MSRDFGGFRQGLFFKLEQIIAAHGAKLAYPTQVFPTFMSVKVIFIVLCISYLLFAVSPSSDCVFKCHFGVISGILSFLHCFVLLQQAFILNYQRFASVK